MRISQIRRLLSYRKTVEVQLRLPPLTLEQLSELSAGKVLPWTIAPPIEQGVVYSLSGGGWSGRFFALPSVVESIKRMVVVRLLSSKGVSRFVADEGNKVQHGGRFPMLRVNHTTELELSIVLGILPLSVRELILLKPGDEFTVRVPLDESAMLMVGEEPFAQVRFEREGERIRVRVESVL